MNADTEREYVVYNIYTDNAITHPAPRNVAEDIRDSFNDDGIRYAIRPDVDEFDYDAAIEATRQDDVRKITLWPLAGDNDYDRQWSVDLHALARFSTRHAITLFVVSQSVMWIIALVVGA